MVWVTTLCDWLLAVAKAVRRPFGEVGAASAQGQTTPEQQ